MRRWPRWFPLYAGAVLVATLTPLLVTCRAQPLQWGFSPLDFGANLALFVPLGVAARGLRRGWVWLIALGGSLAIEVAQLHLPRSPSPFDLLANALGAELGTRWPARPRIAWPSWERVRGPLAGAALAGIAATLWLAHTRPASDFSNWTPQPLLFGTPGESAGSPNSDATDASERPTAWRGEVRQLGVYDRALAMRSDREEWLAERPVLWIGAGEAPAFDAGDGLKAIPIDAAGAALADPTKIRNGFRFPDPVARELERRLRRSGQLSVVAWLRGDERAPPGRARIVSLGRGLTDHAFTFEQHGRSLALRVRTPSDRLHAWQPELQAGFDPAVAQHVVATFDGRVARMHIDGACRAEVFLALENQPWPLAGGIAWTVWSALVAGGLAAAGFARPGRRRAAFAVAAIGVWGCLAIGQAWQHVPGFDAIAVALGATAIAACWPLLTDREASRVD